MDDAPSPLPRNARIAPGDGRLAARLRAAIAGEVLFDAASRGRYATDASIYQIEPLGVVVPKTKDDVAAAFAIAREEGVPLLPRGGGTSQCGQTVGRALVLDTSKYLNRVLALDLDRGSVTVEPGLVYDRLNAALKAHGVWFPVDISTGSRATIGGMTGNNSCGARSIRYGNMVHNVRRIDALLADGTRAAFGPLEDEPAVANDSGVPAALLDRLVTIAERETDEMAARFPRVQRRVGGYLLDAIPARGADGRYRRSPAAAAIHPAPPHPWAEQVGGNLAHLLVGSEGTLAYFEAIELALAPLPRHAALGICHFPSFRDAMANTRHLVALGPTAVELVDRTLLGLAAAIPLFRPTVERFVKGAPEALLLVEFAGDDAAENSHRLAALGELMGDLGFAGAVVEVETKPEQAAVWEMRKACLDIAMSMKGDAKPVSFVEDCAVRIEDLADYTERLTAVFRKYGTEGTWYAHASVGTLHVRPILNLKTPAGVKALRAIAEETFAMVREYRGSHSGEHGDGIVRSEFHRPMYGERIVRAFEDMKDAFDPQGLMNPGKIVRPYRMDDRTLMRFPPDHAPPAVATRLDWSAWGGFLAATEMCNNNGACRRLEGGGMCPSYRVTMDETHATRGRANTLRLALSGKLGPEAWAGDDVLAALDLCVSCKACRRECPTGVDMARMKTEVLAQAVARRGLALKERLIAYLPRYAPWAARAPWLFNLRESVPGLPWLAERLTGLAAERSWPRWRSDPFRAPARPAPTPNGARAVALYADTFNRYFEPENLRAAVRVLERAGYAVHHVTAPGGRPPCCGRTFLSAGLVEEARAEMTRTLAALAPYREAGIPVVALEPACAFTFRDEIEALGLGSAEAERPRVLLIEEFLAAERSQGRLEPAPKPGPATRIVLHGHCHQKAYDTMPALRAMLGLIAGAEVREIESACCGMAGAFGLEAQHQGVSRAMAERSLAPSVRAAPADALVVACGTSCRAQIAATAGRPAIHAVRALERALG